MSKVIHRSLASVPLVAVAGEGIEIIVASGRRNIDASGGAAVACLGHSHPDGIAAMHAQLDKVPYAHTGCFTSEISEKLADHLVAKAPEGIDHVYFVSGGSEAIEASLKLARQYFVEKGEPQRTMFVARRQSYHGNTLGALAVGGNEWRRRQFAPLLIDVGRVSPCFEYRERREGETQDQYTQRLLAELEAKFIEIGPERVIGFVAETVVGATTGAVPPTPGYFRGVRALCDKYGILLIADEVMCGMGRTGTLHAIEQEGVVPDLMAIAKGLGGGYQPEGAVLASGRIVGALQRGRGNLQHGHTYIGHAMGAAAALAVQQVIERDGLLAQVRERGALLRRLLGETFASHPHVGDVRGRGHFMAHEQEAARETQAPNDPALRLHARVKARAMASSIERAR